MADGTIKQVNPFTGTEVWSVPGRSAKPVIKEIPSDVHPLIPADFDSSCAFCTGRVLESPPEKARLVRTYFGAIEERLRVSPEDVPQADWLFRRVPNLFEIVTIDYWKKNYGYRLPPEDVLWKENYLASEAGMKHVLDVLAYKLRSSGYADDKIEAIPLEDRLTMVDAFFGGSHELIIANRHYADGATDSSQLFSSGSMSTEDHYQYFRLTVNAMTDIFQSNRYVRYISIFQNWLGPAGASFDHLHKQLVGLDEWGASIRHQVDMLRMDPNVFNEYGANLASMQNFVFAENEHAIAFVGIGHRHPTIEIFSKSHASRPNEHSEEELRGVSDLVHACHAATGTRISTNEEWYYTPIDAVYKMPWHVLIKWRVNTTAGFEGGTSIFINPMSPAELRDRIVPSLYRLRDAGVIPNSIRLAEECKLFPNPLKYHLP